MGLCQALVLADHEEPAALPGGGGHGLAVGQGGGHGLLAEHMLAPAQRFHDPFVVLAVDRGNIHDLHAGILKKRFIIMINMLNLITGSERLRLFGIS